MGWGIRGQYGHETGAMIAGLLVSLVLVFLFCPKAALLPAARAVAFGTIAIGLGGSMTYGQTIGLTQNPGLIGNWEAWRWGMLVAGEFSDLRWANELYDPGIVIALIPIIAVAGGRWWPFLLVLPGTLLPVAGKTIRTLVHDAHAIDPAVGWVLYGVLPMLLTTAAAVWFARQIEGGVSGRAFARRSLLLTAWLYFGLNLALFRFPWPWDAWTSRTPNALVYTVCLLGLTLACATIGRRQDPHAVAASA